MTKPTKPTIKDSPKTSTEKLIVFTQGGKGGVGKTTFALLLLDYYKRLGLKTKVFDLDNENKANAGLAAFWSEAQKINIDQRDGMDALLDGVQSDAGIIFADMGSRSGATAFRWFDDMAEAVSELGVGFTSIGLVTDDPASVASVIEWAKMLRDRVRHMVVLNPLSDPTCAFDYWHKNPHVEKYIELAHPAVVKLDSINGDLQNLLRVHNTTIAAVADKATDIEELQKLKWSIRAQAIRRNIDAEFERVVDVLLP